MTVLRPSRTALAGAALLVALGCALLPGGPVTIVIVLAVLGALAGLAVVAPGVVRALRAHPPLLIVAALTIVIVAWVVAGLLAAGQQWHFFPAAAGQLVQVFTGRDGAFSTTSWPWRVDRVPLLALAVILICACGGFALICDAVRVALGLGRPPRSMWRAMTATSTRSGRTAARAIPGISLVVVLTILGISLISRYSGVDPVLATLATLGLCGLAVLLVAAPVAVGLATRLDVDKAGRAREEERRRLAAHLHDSVLQTLALVQRQAGDAAAVTRLARRQEHALRAWMAGEADLGCATVATAVQEMVDEVEEENAMTVELTAIGDTDLEPSGEQLVAAAREALRNTARHAPGAPVTVFLDIDTERIEMFIRDGGPGFDVASVPAERRGLRDAVIGRMRFAGGSATVESAPGDGTEVTLRLPATGRRR